MNIQVGIAVIGASILGYAIWKQMKQIEDSRRKVTVKKDKRTGR